MAHGGKHIWHNFEPQPFLSHQHHNYHFGQRDRDLYLSALVIFKTHTHNKKKNNIQVHFSREQTRERK